jgi:hypothetical protein
MNDLDPLLTTTPPSPHCSRRHLVVAVRSHPHALSQPRYKDPRARLGIHKDPRCGQDLGIRSHQANVREAVLAGRASANPSAVEQPDREIRDPKVSYMDNN